MTLLTNNIKHLSAIQRTTVCTLVMLLVSLSLFGQSASIPSDGSAMLHLAPGGTYTIYDPGGNSNYLNNCNGTLTLVSDDSCAITVTGNYYTEFNCDFINIYEGLSTESPILGIYSGVGNINKTAHTGIVTIQFRSDALINHAGFALTVTVCDIVEGQVYNVGATSITDTSATLDWDDSTGATSWTVFWGTTPACADDSATVQSSNATITGLSQYTTYYYRVSNGREAVCPTMVRRFKTICTAQHSGCIDYSDLYSCFVTARHGEYLNPDQNSGIIDYGYTSGLSRHTVHTDTSERDMRTGGMLRTIPQGYTSSVRLGNWNSGGEAESITYEYTVDTTVSNMLILKYAAVLEDPYHPAVEQPMFTFKILDQDFLPINSSCYSATFVANSSLGWNEVANSGFLGSNTLWKDWTTVGIDLTPLHGQTILIKLTTYDCARMQHYGYAYFVIDCAEKIVTSANCGEIVENTFYAPEGFSYRWYNAEAPSVTLSTESSLYVNQSGEYHCQLQFVGAPAGASCSFDLVAIAGARYPAASFTWQQILNDDCTAQLKLHNTSVISQDSAHQQLTNLPCEGAFWLIDGDSVASSNNIIVDIEPGPHTIQLVASLANGFCTDTATQGIRIDYPCVVYDTVTTHLCPGGRYTLFDTILTEAGTYQRDSANLHRTLVIQAAFNDTVSLNDTIVENTLPYSWNGHTIAVDSLTDNVENMSTFNFKLSTTNTLLCDSTVFLNLTVWHNVSTHIDSTLCGSSLPFVWNGDNVTANSLDSNSRISYFTFQQTVPNIHGADSSVTLSLSVIHSDSTIFHDTICGSELPYIWNGNTINTNTDINSKTNLKSQLSTLNSFGCDSTVSLSLTVHPTYNFYYSDTVCQEAVYAFSDTSFTATQTGTSALNFRYSTINGCDSAITMSVTVNPVNHIHMFDTVVENRLPYNWNGLTITTDSMTSNGDEVSTYSAEITFQNTFSCDSSETLSLLVWNNRVTHLTGSACQGVYYTFIDTSFITAQAGTYTVSSRLSTLHGADSTVILTLTVFPTYDTTLYGTVCQESEYTFTDTVFMAAQPGIVNHSALLATINGCDSLVSLVMTVNPVFSFSFVDTICQGADYTFADTSFTAAQAGISTIISHLSTQQGCDSTLSLDLTVNPTHHMFDNAKVCDGVPYIWIDGNTYAHSTYEPTVTYTNIYGCDSVHHLLLSLDNGFEASMSVTPTTVTPEHPEVRLTDRSQSSSRQWFFDGNSDTSRITTFTYLSEKDSLPVLLVARNSTGCIDSVWGHVSCDRAVVWAPNAFTPDEQQNNRFSIFSNDIVEGEVWIYNRQGQFISHFDVLSGSWDGTHNGIDCPQGAYTWKLIYSTRSNPRQKKQLMGTISLLR